MLQQHAIGSRAHLQQADVTVQFLQVHLLAGAAPEGPKLVQRHCAAALARHEVDGHFEGVIRGGLRPHAHGHGARRVVFAHRVGHSAEQGGAGGGGAKGVVVVSRRAGGDEARGVPQQ